MRLTRATIRSRCTIQSPLDVSVSDFASDDPSGGLVRLNISSSYTDPICATSEEIEAINSALPRSCPPTSRANLKGAVSEGEVMGTLTYTAPSGDKYYFTMTAANSVAAAPATDLPSIDELMQPDEAAGESTTSPLIWIVPLAAVIWRDANHDRNQQRAHAQSPPLGFPPAATAPMTHTGGASDAPPPDLIFFELIFTGSTVSARPPAGAPC